MTDSLHKDGAIHELSRHSQKWMPDFGLGIWPDREAPRMYQDSDFLDLEFGAKLPKMMHSIVHISAGEEAALHAWETMFGTGSTLLVLSDQSADVILREMRKPALEKIKDEVFRAFPWYFTLAGTRFATQADTALLDDWLGPVHFYLRESEEDDGILVLSRYELTEVLQTVGPSLT